MVAPPDDSETARVTEWSLHSSRTGIPRMVREYIDDTYAFQYEAFSPCLRGGVLP